MAERIKQFMIFFGINKNSFCVELLNYLSLFLLKTIVHGYSDVERCLFYSLECLVHFHSIAIFCIKFIRCMKIQPFLLFFQDSQTGHSSHEQQNPLFIPARFMHRRDWPPVVMPDLGHQCIMPYNEFSHVQFVPIHCGPPPSSYIVCDRPVRKFEQPIYSNQTSLTSHNNRFAPAKMFQNNALEECESEDSSLECEKPIINIEASSETAVNELSPCQRYSHPIQMCHSPRVHQDDGTPVEHRPLFINFPRLEDSPTGSDELSPLLTRENEESADRGLGGCDSREATSLLNIGSLVSVQNTPNESRRQSFNTATTFQSFIRQAMFRPLYPARVSLLTQPVLPVGAFKSRLAAPLPYPQFNSSSQPQLTSSYNCGYVPPTNMSAPHPTSEDMRRNTNQLSPPHQTGNLPPINRSLDSIPLRTRNPNPVLRAYSINNTSGRPTFYSPRHQYS